MSLRRAVGISRVLMRGAEAAPTLDRHEREFGSRRLMGKFVSIRVLNTGAPNAGAAS